MKKKLRNKSATANRQLAMEACASRLVALFMLIAVVTGCSRNETTHEHDTYTCPMHPTVVSDRPGTCPVCGMDLVRNARPGEDAEMTEDLSRLLKSPNEMVVSSIATVKGEYKSLPVSVHAQGIVTYDTRNIYTIPARVSGRLEKVYLKYMFQHVSKGQKIAEIYSPELITVQRELLFLLGNDAANEALINGAKKKLEHLGLSGTQISSLTKREEPDYTLSIFSPYSGYLITGSQAVPETMPSTQPSGSGMVNDKRPTSPVKSDPNSSIVREGDYVASGQTLFNIVNSSALRIELDLPGAHSGTVKEGNNVLLSFRDGDDIAATVDFVQPFFTEGQDFLKIRVSLKNTDGLHVGQLVNAKIDLESTEALWVPKQAVLDLGIQKVVFLEDRGAFKPVQVTTGVSADGMIQIKSGLASSEVIAANAQFLVDSESFVKPVN